MFFGLVLGFILALMRMSPVWPIKWLARMYISIFRGTPLIAQLFMIYYGLPQFGIELDPIPAAMIGLSLNTAAYAAETLRAAIASIDKGAVGGRGEYWYDALAGYAPRDSSSGRARGVTAAFQQFYQPGERYLAGGNYPGARTVPSGSADHLPDAGGIHHVPGRFAYLLGNGNGAFHAAKLF